MELTSTFVLEFAVATFVSVLAELAICIKRCSTRYQTQPQDQRLRYMAWGATMVLAGLALAHFVPGMDCVTSADWESDDNVKREDAEDLREILGLVFAVVAWISIVVAYPVMFLVNKSTDEPYREASQIMVSMNLFFAVGATTGLGIALARLLKDDPLPGWVDHLIDLTLRIWPFAIGLLPGCIIGSNSDSRSPNRWLSANRRGKGWERT